MSIRPLAIQLWTVRDELQRDAPAAFRALKAAGYSHVEVASMEGTPPEDIVAMLGDAGLRAMGAHIPYGVVAEDTGAAVEYAQALSVDYATVPWIGPDQCSNRSDWVAAARAMDIAGGEFRESGITLCYHHHGHEFERFDGETIFDIIMANADPEHLAAEVDTYWATFGGVDPVALIQQYKGRCPLLHLKDMANDAGRSFAEVGHGVLDWTAIFDAAQAAGVAWYIVEQDECPRGSLESARLSAAYLNSR